MSAITAAKVQLQSELTTLKVEFLFLFIVRQKIKSKDKSETCRLASKPFVVRLLVHKVKAKITRSTQDTKTGIVKN